MNGSSRSRLSAQARDPPTGRGKWTWRRLREPVPPLATSLSIGRSVMRARPRSGATESASTPARRRAAREDAPPPVPRRRRLAKDVHVFVTVDALVRRAPPGGELLDERQARRARLAQLDDPGVRLAGIREGLPLPERVVEEPLAASRPREPGGSTPAVGEDGRRLVDHEVLEAALRAEVFARHQQVVSSLMPTRSGAPGPRGPRADAP